MAGEFTAIRQVGHVTKKSLIERINRKLRKDDKKLRKCRSARDHSTLGDYFIINLSGNYIINTWVDLEGLGREIGAMQGWETLVE